MIAARKLKFKPKPSVSGAGRRTRDKDEIPDHSQKEPGVTEKKSEHTSFDNVNADEDHAPKKLKIDHTSYEGVLSSEKCVSSESEVMHITQECKQSVESDGRFDINNIIKPIINITNQQINNTVLTEPILSTSSSTNSIVSNTVGSENLNCNNDESVVSDNKNSRNSHSNMINTDSNKPDIAKVPVVPRFARSRCKPILSNSGMRKKNNTSPPVDDSVKENTDIRTDSVIKSVQVELNKINATVLDITDSFSSLETEEDSLPVRTTIKDQINKTQTNIQVSETVGTSDKLTHGCEAEHNLTDSSCLNGSNRQISGNILLENELTNCQKSIQEFEPNENNAEVLHTHTVSSTSTKVLISKTISKVLAPKPSPRLLDVCGRRISFQGSDSEDEARRRSLNAKEMPKSVIAEKKEKELKKAKRKRSQGSTYSKLGQDTLQKFEKKFGNIEPPDKNKLTMLDLIFYNPKSNPMTVSSAVPSGRKREEKSDVSEAVEESLAEQSVDDVESTTSSLPVPQLTVGPDGQIMLDPKSLVIETTGTEKGRLILEKSQLVHDSGIVRYNTYSKKKHQRSDWTPQETLQFYRVLNTIGSDFALMTKLFPKRSRHELKLKFKREEKVNLHLIDKAMTKPIDFDFKSLEEELKLENEEIEKKAQDKKLFKENAKRERLIKKEKKLKPKSNRRIGRSYSEFDEEEKKQLRDVKEPQKLTRKRKEKSQGKKSAVEEIDSDLDEELQIDIDLVSRTSSLSPRNSDEEGLNLIKIVKATCSGRVPKPTKKLEEYEELNETLKKKLQKDFDSEDSYIPNGPGADELFGSPKEMSQETEEKPWNIHISSLPNIEETVLGNTEEVSEISELGSFGQNSDTALDLSMMRGGTQEDSPENPQNKTLLNRHLISESIQIIDQLTSDVESHRYPEVKDIQNYDSEDIPDQGQVVDKVPLPSFESVSRSWPAMIYTHVQAPYSPVETISESVISDSITSIEPNVVFNFYNSNPTVNNDDSEYIVGD